MPTLQRDPIAASVIFAAVEVHRALGPGLLEGVYTSCLTYELHQRGLLVEQEVAIPVIYKGVHMDCGFRMDLCVDQSIIVEVKCVDQLLSVHTAQVLTYLRLSNMKQAFLINFNGVTLMEGLRSYLGTRVETSH